MNGCNKYRTLEGKMVTVSWLLLASTNTWHTMKSQTKLIAVMAETSCDCWDSNNERERSKQTLLCYCEYLTLEPFKDVFYGTFPKQFLDEFLFSKLITLDPVFFQKNATLRIGFIPVELGQCQMFVQHTVIDIFVNTEFVATNIVSIDGV